MGVRDLMRKLEPLPEGPLAIGLSGGADSVALLTMLRMQGRQELYAVHVNHGLRGRESDGDEAFVRALCPENGIPLTVYRAELGDRRDENTAREARFAFFRQAMKETGAAALALAHHRDDLAETFLMRLLRGSGPDGLGCMSADDSRMGIRIVRPMLGMTREEIREALREDGIPWREDESNNDTRFLRNAIRNRVVPLLEELSPGASGRIARTARLAAADNAVLEALAREAAEGNTERPWLDSEVLQEQPEAVQARILRAWWKANGPKLDEHTLNEPTTKALMQLARTETGSVNLPGGFRCLKRNGTLFLTGGSEERKEPVLWRAPETAFGDIRLRQAPGQGDPGDGKTCQEVPEGFAEGCVIRTRQDGDCIRPFGSSGSRKLQDYLTDRKISLPWRDRIPLLCREKEVLLVCGVGAGNVPAWQPDGRNIRLQWIGEMPWMKETERKT